MTTDQIAERFKHLSELNALKRASTFKAKKTEITELREPIRVKILPDGKLGLCKINYNGFFLLGTDNNFYKLTGRSLVRIARYEPALDTGWNNPNELTETAKSTQNERQQTQKTLQEQRDDYLETFQNALPHERTDIMLQAEFDEMVDEYLKSEDCKRDNERIEAFAEQLEDERRQREKQGLLEIC